MMKILLTGNAPLGMLVLSTVDRSNKFPVFTNMIPPRNYKNPIDEVEDFVDMCREPRANAVHVYNDTPWSNVTLDKYKSPVLPLKKKIYNLCGWMPNAIIHIYDANQRDPKSEGHIKKLCQTEEIPVYSLDCKDHSFEKNIREVVDIIAKTSTTLKPMLTHDSSWIDA